MKQTFNKFTDYLMAILFLSMAMLLLGAITSCSPKIVLPTTDRPLPEWFPTDDPTEIGETAPDYDTIQWVKVLQLDGDVIMISLDSLMNSDKIVIDTIWVAGEEVIVTDSMPCPPGLERDSFVNFTLTRFLPSRSVPVSMTVLDTVWLTKPCPTPVVQKASVASSGSGWGERIAWLGSVLLLLLGYWNSWRKKQKAKT